jgi:hypothetical protein
MVMTNTLAYYDMAIITAVKRGIVLAREKKQSFLQVISFFKPGACITKLITVVIYGFRNKLECLSLITRLGWKGLPGTNTLAYYGNHKLRP